MSKSKSVDIPAAPSFQSDPRFGGGIDYLMNRGKMLSAGEMGLLPPLLQETVSLSPDITKYALQMVRSELDPVLREQRQEVINQLAANNQLESSVTANRLGLLESDYENKVLGLTAEAAMADIDRALQNRISLFGTGLETVRAATGFAGENQQMINEFNLRNYENQIAAALYSEKDQGGFAGGLMGGAGGAMSGAAAGAVLGSVIPGIGTAAGAIAGGVAGAAGGGYAGYTGPSMTGSMLLGQGLESGLGALGQWQNQKSLAELVNKIPQTKNYDLNSRLLASLK